MKKEPSPRHLIVLALTLLMAPFTFAQTPYSCPADSQTKASFDQEFQIAVNRKPYTITQGQIDEKAEFFRTRIHYAENPNPGPIRYEAIDVVKTLYCEAERLRSDLNLPPNTYITGVWMIIGMENNDICYSFRPAVLKVESHVDTIYTFTTTEKEGHVYSYRNNDFYNDDSGWRAKQELYFERVRIKHTRLGGHKQGRFRNSDGSFDNTWRGDAREVFYSFQEILGFYSDHNPQEKPGGFFSGAIYVNHSAANFTSVPKGINSWRAKHNTFITVDSNNITNNQKVAITSVTDQKNVDPGTNLAHVCPSVCNSLQYGGLQRERNTAKAKK